MADNAGGQSKHDGGSPAAPYAVGYGKPPKHTRFRPGHSGNPSGRRRKPRSLVRDLVEVLHEPVISDEGGAGEGGTVGGAARETITKQHSILRALAAKAMAGDHKAMVQVIELAQWMSGSTPGYWFDAPEDWDADGPVDGEVPENSLPPGKNRE